MARWPRLEEVSMFSAHCTAMRSWPGKPGHTAIFVFFLLDQRPVCFTHVGRFSFARGAAGGHGAVSGEGRGCSVRRQAILPTCCSGRAPVFELEVSGEGIEDFSDRVELGRRRAAAGL